MTENTQTDAALVECFAVIDRLAADRDRWKADADRLAAGLRSANDVLYHERDDLHAAVGAALAAHDALTAETETT